MARIMKVKKAKKKSDMFSFDAYEENVVQLIFTNYRSTTRRVYKDRKTGENVFLNKNMLYKIFNYDSANNEYEYAYLRENVKTKTEKEIVYVDRITNEKVEDKETLKFADEAGHIEYDEDPTHPLQDKIEACVRRKLPVYLYGDAGTGKNFILQKIANILGLDFYYTNSVQEEYKITGFIDATGDYHETEFYKAFKHGGLFFLDEMDASIPGVLVLLNAAIANGYFEFPNGRINAHEDFRVVAAGNTCGHGADEMYTGRLVLDGASLDRFVYIHLDYDYKIELALTKGNKWLVDFVHELRDISKRNGIRATFSYRCLMMVTELEAEKFPLEMIFEIAIFKGMGKDEMAYFQTMECKTKYERTLAKIIEKVA